MKWILEMGIRKFGRGGTGKVITGVMGVLILLVFFLSLSSIVSKRDDFKGLPIPLVQVISNKNPKVLCYVLLEEGKIGAGKIIRETWGSRCDEVLFFGNFVTQELPVIQTNVTEGYKFLWGKSKAALKYMYQHHSEEFNWFLKADDDTFIILENLRSFILTVQEKGAFWFGFKMKHSKMQEGYMSGGAGYAFNSKALEKVVGIFNSNLNSTYYRYDINVHRGIGCRTVDDHGIEDLELGRCFEAAGVGDVSTLDARGRERFLPLSLSTVMAGNVSPFHWVWVQAWNKFKTGKNCCSSELISFHEVPSSQLRILYFILYQLKPNVQKNIIERNKIF